MNKKQKIQKELLKQLEIEKDLTNYKILSNYLECITTQMQWNVFVKCKFHKYGTQSYQTYKFYYPTEELLSILKISVNKHNEI